MTEWPGTEDDKPLEAEFRKNLVQRRKWKGLSQAELAELVDKLGHRMHQQTVAKIEAGSRSVRIDEMTAFARALDLTLDEMLHPALPSSPHGTREVLEGERRQAAEWEPRVAAAERAYLEAKLVADEREKHFNDLASALDRTRFRIVRLETHLIQLEKHPLRTKGAVRGKHQTKG